MKIGILKETKSPADSRVPLTPVQCSQILEEFPGFEIFVQPSPERSFSDSEYKTEGIPLATDLSHCDILMGVKEVKPESIISGKTYFIFSHTIKKQPYNKGLLQAALNKHIRLVDYEMLTDGKGVRIIGFGRWAGLTGTYNGIRAFCLREGLQNLVPPQDCNGLEGVKRQARSVRLPPVRIALTGDGRVAGGSEEMLDVFGVKKVTVAEFLEREHFDGPVYAQLDPAKYNRNTLDDSFDLPHFFNFPEKYASNFGRFCNKTDILIMAAYWDPRAPVLFTLAEMKQRDFRIRVIADITCDIHGSVPSSIRTSSFSQPYYDFNPWSAKEEIPFSNPDNITVMTIDNLPCGLPKEASTDFGHNLMKNVLPLFQGGDNEAIIERATITNKGKLTARYNYLDDWVHTY